ncbi:hypothetical protein SSBR45G_28060 [Bradyrhizobium sp. SSBR45G]|nr:hypothetical protein SSBR45G_28060 [Bradyrhizobium sp. SSBR45G]GLH85481.1 hypothetical protein SSBR45R_29410 [Bradyrhizobium sp. SSBR45R]
MVTVEFAPAAATAATAVFQSAWLATSIAMACVLNMVPARRTERVSQRRDLDFGAANIVLAKQAIVFPNNEGGGQIRTGLGSKKFTPHLWSRNEMLGHILSSAAKTHTVRNVVCPVFCYQGGIFSSWRP